MKLRKSTSRFRILELLLFLLSFYLMVHLQAVILRVLFVLLAGYLQFDQNEIIAVKFWNLNPMCSTIKVTHSARRSCSPHCFAGIRLGDNPWFLLTIILPSVYWRDALYLACLSEPFRAELWRQVANFHKYGSSVQQFTMEAPAKFCKCYIALHRPSG